MPGGALRSCEGSFFLCDRVPFDVKCGAGLSTGVPGVEGVASIGGGTRIGWVGGGGAVVLRFIKSSRWLLNVFMLARIFRTAGVDF